MKNAKDILDALQPTLKSGTEAERNMAINLLGILLGGPKSTQDEVSKTINTVLNADLSLETYLDFFVAILTAWPEDIISISQHIIHFSKNRNGYKFSPAFTVAVLQSGKYFRSSTEHNESTHFNKLHHVLKIIFSANVFWEILKLQDPMSGRLSNAISEFITFIPFQNLLKLIECKDLLGKAMDGTFAFQVINGLCMRSFGNKNLGEKLFLLEKG
jgi:hypothetical protein